LFIMHSIAADRSLHDLGLTPKAKRCEAVIKKALIIMKENYQPVLGRDYGWDLVRSLHGRCSD
jgi:hypothetical protein